MKIGARAYEIEDIKFLGKSGFDFAEIDLKNPDLVQAQLPDLTRLKKEYGISYLAHGPNEPSPFDADEIDRIMTPVLSRLFELAGKLDITVYTQHLWLDQRFIEEKTISRKLALLDKWIEAADGNGIRLCIENLSELPDHFSLAFNRIPGLSMTLDVGHGELLSPVNTAYGFIRRFSHRIRHVHVHDNFGGNDVKADRHLPIGEGRVDFDRILADLIKSGYTGTFSLELKGAHVLSGRRELEKIFEKHL